MGIKDSASGYDLARGGNSLLWLIPFLMLTIILLGPSRAILKRLPILFALTSTVGGALSAFVMYREYTNTNRSANLIAAQWTVWFWLGLAASISIAVAALVFYARRSRSP